MDKHPKEFVAFVKFGCTFGANFYGGYAREKGSDETTFATRTKNALLNQRPKLQDVIFIHGDYTIVSEAKDSVLYLDKPYEGTKDYKGHGFDHKKFWGWAKEMAQNNVVFVSEYNAPEFAEVVHDMWIDRCNRSEALSTHVSEKLYRIR